MLFNKKPQTFKGWPDTTIKKDGIVVTAKYQTPKSAKIQESMCGAILLIVLAFWFFTKSDLQESFIFGFFIFIVTRIFISPFDGKIKVIFSEKLIRVETKGYWEEFRMELPHSFGVELHQEAQEEEDQARKGKHVGRFYRDSFHLFLDHLQGRFYFPDVFEKKKADMLVNRLKGVDEYLRNYQDFDDYSPTAKDPYAARNKVSITGEIGSDPNELLSTNQLNRLYEGILVICGIAIFGAIVVFIWKKLERYLTEGIYDFGDAILVDASLTTAFSYKIDHHFSRITNGNGTGEDYFFFLCLLAPILGIGWLIWKLTKKGNKKTFEPEIFQPKPAFNAWMDRNSKREEGNDPLNLTKTYFKPISRKPAPKKISEKSTWNPKNFHKSQGNENGNLNEEENFDPKVAELVPPIKEWTGGDPFEELDNMIGLKEVKDQVTGLISAFTNQMRREKLGLQIPARTHHMLFTGNPGTGKTTVARIMAQILHETGINKKTGSIELDRSKIVGAWRGHTENKFGAILTVVQGRLLFIDEAYSLYHHKSCEDHDGKTIVDQLNKALEDKRAGFVVILAGYEKEMEEFLKANPGLKDRIPHKIHFPDYSPEELHEIFMHECQKGGFSLTPEAQNKAMFVLENIYNERDERFANGRTVRNFYEDTLGRLDKRTAPGNPSKEELMTIQEEDIPEY